MERVEQEVMALRAMPFRNFFGETYTYAFGIGDSAENDYLFQIDFDRSNRKFLLTIDFYRWQLGDGDEFDAEVWQASMVQITGSGDDLRKTFYVMKQVARGLLSGRTVILPDGEAVELNQWRIQ